MIKWEKTKTSGKTIFNSCGLEVKSNSALMWINIAKKNVIWSLQEITKRGIWYIYGGQSKELQDSFSSSCIQIQNIMT